MQLEVEGKNLFLLIMKDLGLYVGDTNQGVGKVK
jgi:hypothetical protein